MKNVLLKFMEKAGKNNEFKMFLDLYLSLPKLKFAVIKVSGKVMEENLDIIAEDIATLNKLGIYPIIVHGAGSIIDKMLPQVKKIDNIRVTTKEDVAQIKELFNKISTDLKNKIIEKGGSAGVAKSVFSCEQEMPKYGYAGKITDVNLFELEIMLENNITPIISPLGNCAGTDVSLNADNAAKMLVKKIEPKKFIFVTETGGVVDKKGKVIPYLNISSRSEIRLAESSMSKKLVDLKEFIKTTPDCSVAITGPENILEELFTIKGGGTFLKYHIIRSTKNPSAADKQKIKELIESVFKKKLKEGYFNDVTDVIYEKDFEGVAVMKKIGDIPYLDKFAVLKIRQGTGLGQSLWDDMLKDYPKFAWRSTPTNPVNIFYLKNCSGMMKKAGWNVYWINLNDDEIFKIVDLVSSKEISWETEPEQQNGEHT